MVLFLLMFVGTQMGLPRQALNKPETTALFEQARLRTKVYGWAMRDGQLPPQDPLLGLILLPSPQPAPRCRALFRRNFLIRQTPGIQRWSCFWVAMPWPP